MQTWLNDHTSDAFVVCTSNDISTLPSAFTRAERFDGLFYVGLPGVQQRRAIWRIYTERYGLDPNQPQPVDADFSGAKIKSCCRLAALDVPLVEAALNVVPSPGRPRVDRAAPRLGLRPLPVGGRSRRLSRGCDWCGGEAGPQGPP